jgi:hypothetical protein
MLPALTGIVGMGNRPEVSVSNYIAPHSKRLDSHRLSEFKFFGVGLVGVPEEDMGTLVFICPATGQEVSTGIEMDGATLIGLRSEQVRCPHCPQPHSLSGIRAWTVGQEPMDILPGLVAAGLPTESPRSS